MNASQVKRCSKQTLRRLPAYHRLLKRMATTGRENVSCTRIARELHLDPTQVRKDLAVTGAVGRPRVGFRVDEALGAIEEFLGWNNANDAVLVGAGALGAALIGYPGFARHGLRILAAFDADSAKVGKEIRGCPVYGVDRLYDLVDRLKVRVGVLTVPAEAAQDVADQMILAGIEGIWNLTPAWLDVPESIVVENVELSASLAVLSSRLAERGRTPR